VPIDFISRRLLRDAGTHGPLALMYHSVVHDNSVPEWKWAVSYRRFVAQLDLLRDEGWTTVCVRDLVHPAGLPDRTVVLTFDDGYADNYPAFEALAQRGMQATWFIVSRNVGNMSGWDDGVAPQRMLSGEQLRTMTAAGMEIGAHSCSHARLTELNDADLADEIVRSKTELAEIVGEPVQSFAYPYGKHDDRVVEAVRRAGYANSCITRPGWALRDNDPLRIRRVSIFAQDDLASFARKLAFADNDVSWRHMLRYASGRAVARLRP
jgi:peptidoglycan/xylan/chitin deacetylase (PgdA/CDA1 family)